MNSAEDYRINKEEGDEVQVGSACDVCKTFDACGLQLKLPGGSKTGAGVGDSSTGKEQELQKEASEGISVGNTSPNANAVKSKSKNLTKNTDASHFTIRTLNRIRFVFLHDEICDLRYGRLQIFRTLNRIFPAQLAETQLKLTKKTRKKRFFF